MIKTKKTTLCVLLVAVLMFSTSMAVFAASPYETRYNSTVTASSSVSISDRWCCLQSLANLKELEKKQPKAK